MEYVFLPLYLHLGKLGFISFLFLKNYVPVTDFDLARDVGG